MTSIFSEVSYLVNYDIWRKFYDGKYSKFPQIDASTASLVIMLHGLYSSSGQFQKHIDFFENYNSKNNRKIKMFVPEILNRGYAELNLCSNAIFDQFKDYINNIIDLRLPIIFLGFSYGGRIALYLYAKVSQLYNYDYVYVSAIASPLKGTLLANKIIKNGLYKLSAYKDIYNVLLELSHNSDISTSLVDNCIKYSRFYTNTKFYASTDDMIVYPYTSSIVEFCNNVVINGIGHNGLLVHFCKDQVMWCLKIIQIAKL